jgi:LuxR family maltose regulon positive regulatory protein
MTRPDSPNLRKTKFHIPLPPETLIPRPRLVDKLNFGVQEKLILITAPAGFGKTTLLAEWVAQNRNPVAWISLDESDNDPLTFFSCLIASFSTIGVSVGKKVMETFKLQKAPSIQRLLLAIVNELSGFPQEMRLVLDDFHRLTNPEILDAVCDFITDVPANLHLIISSRTVPNIPCAKYHSQRQLTTIDERDLKFNRDELGAFFQDNFTISLSREEIIRLENLTEGWVIALQMAGIALQENPEKLSLLHSFRGAQLDIQQYFLEEVLQAQPAQIKEALLEASILERFCAPLLDYLSQRNDGADTILYLKEKKLFIFSLDEEGEWYRFHQLFRSLLNHHLQLGTPGNILHYHTRAADWYRERGFWSDAIQHDLLAKNYNQAASDIERIVEQYWQIGETATILGWIRALPEEYIRNNPDLEIFRAWMLYMDGQIHEASLMFSKIQRYLEDEGEDGVVPVERKEQIKGKVSAIKAAYFCTVNQPQEALACSKTAQELLEPATSNWLGVSFNAQGVSFRSLGQRELAIQSFNHAIEEHKRSKNLYGLLVALSALAEIYLDQGNLQLVIETCQRANQLLSHGDPRFIPGGVIFLSMGKVYLEWAEFKRAEEYLIKGIEVLIEDQDLDCLLEAYFHLACLKQHTEGIHKAIQIMAVANAMMAEKNPPFLLSLRSRAYLARILIFAGQIDQAAVHFHYIEPGGIAPERFKEVLGQLQAGRTPAYVVARNPGFYNLAVEQITQALILIQQKSAAEAVLILKGLINESGGLKPSHPQVVDTYLLLALAYHALEDEEKCLQMLRTALLQTMHEGHIFSYIRFGSPMREILEQLLEQEKAHGPTRVEAHLEVALILYINKLLAAFRLREGLGEHCEDHAKRTRLVEVLTGREEEVLQLLAKGFSYYEIAQSLSVTENTVRTHIKNIYGKMSVNNRVQAVTRAIDLNLIAPDDYK